MERTVCIFILQVHEVERVPQIASPLIDELVGDRFIFSIGHVIGAQRIWIITRDRAIGKNGDDRAVRMLHTDHHESVTGEFQGLTGVLCIEAIPAVREQNDWKTSIRLCDF